MTEMPETVTLDWIGRTLLNMREEQKALSERVSRFEADTSRRFDEVRRDALELKERFTRFEVAQIRLEDRMRSVDDGVREAIRLIRLEVERR